MRRFIAVCLFALIALSALTPARAQPSGDLLAFVSFRDRDSTTQTIAVQVYDFASETLTTVSDFQYHDVRGLTWSADRQLAFTGVRAYQDEDLLLWDGRRTRVLLAHVRLVGLLDWSADGRLAFVAEVAAQQVALYVWDGSDLRVLAENATGFGAPQWSADGKLAFHEGISDEPRIAYVWDGAALTALCSAPVSCTTPVWSPDGQRLVFRLYPDGLPQYIPCADCSPPPAPPPMGISVWQDGQQVTVVAPQSGSTLVPVWQPDGRLVVVKDSTIYLWDGGALNLVRALEPGLRYWDGSSVALISAPYGPGMDHLTVWRDVFDPADAGVLLVENAGWIQDVRWSADGRLAFHASTEDGYRVYVWDGGDDLTMMMADDYSWDQRPAWSPDGRRLALVSNLPGRFDVYIWDGQSTTRPFVLPDSDEDFPVWWDGGA